MGPFSTVASFGSLTRIGGFSSVDIHLGCARGSGTDLDEDVGVPFYPEGSLIGLLPLLSAFMKVESLIGDSSS